MSEQPANQPYPEFVANLKRRLDYDTAMRVAVGGDFLAVGSLQYQLLKFCGLRETDTVIDVGCGSGRLGCQLSRHPGIKYTGTDVVPDLIEYARQLCQRPDWHFEVTNGTAIPAQAHSADFVCFFSVFTHLPHDQCYRYLLEATHVLRPGGRIVLSFLEFQVDAHWAMFTPAAHTSGHLNQFIEQNVLFAWARRLGLVVERVVSGDLPFIPLSELVQWDDGRQMRGKGNLGQSVAVLRVPGHSTRSLPASATATPLSRQIQPVISARGHVGSGPFNLRLTFNLPKPANVLVRATTRSLEREGYGHLLPQPHVLVAGANGSVIAANSGFDRLPEAIQHLVAELECDAHGIGPADAVLWLQLPPQEYCAAVRDVSDREGLVDLQVFVL